MNNISSKIVERFCYCQTPIGLLRIGENDIGITRVEIVDEAEAKEQESTQGKYLGEAKKQIEEYFYNGRRTFNLPLSFCGTEFQKRVWRELTKIPYGVTKSYQDIAIAIGNAKATRAVGQANNKNKILIIVPCHRVIGKNKKLVGYAEGLDKKEFLLEIEKNNTNA